MTYFITNKINLFVLLLYINALLSYTIALYDEITGFIN